MSFRFLNPGRLVDRDLSLVLDRTTIPPPELDWVPAYHFDMVHTGHHALLGQITLRVGSGEFLEAYAGHIGYTVYPDFRGEHYAARSVKLLLALAWRHNLTPLWITCNPENIASRRSCELAGGTFVEIVDLPPGNEMYDEGDRQKCRYRWDRPRQMFRLK